MEFSMVVLQAQVILHPRLGFRFGAQNIYARCDDEERGSHNYVGHFKTIVVNSLKPVWSSAETVGPKILVPEGWSLWIEILKLLGLEKVF
jgi:hypothetical protein